MRLLYQYITSKLSVDDCRIIINYLRSRIATDLGETLPTDIFYKFITTSRPVEQWLLSIEQKIRKMGRKKTPPELWVIIGGYGAGKSHMKEYVVDAAKKSPHIQTLTIEIADLLPTELNESSSVDNIYSLTLLRTMGNLDNLYNEILKIAGSTQKVAEVMDEHLSDKEFVNVFCGYGEALNNHNGDIYLLRDLIIKNGSQLFIPIMKLYKKYLKINGICIFIDEFEDLQHFSPEIKRNRFFESIRAFYDTLTKVYQDPELPSFEIVILCTLSYWEKLTEATSSQGLETRAKDFEIPQLIEDEIITVAEKLYAIYKKAGQEYLRNDMQLDFTKTPNYLAKIAGIENPLTPRFVIKELIKIIEEPAAFIGFTSQSQ